MTFIARLTAAGSQMRSHLRRTALAMLTTFVGIWAITTTVAVGDMGKAAALRQAEITQGIPATLVMALADSTHASLAMNSSTRLRIEERLARYGLGDYSPMARSTIGVFNSSASLLIEANGVEPGFADVRRFNMVSGTWLSSGAMADLGPLVVANTGLISALHLDPSSALRAPIRLGSLAPITARIIGVVSSTASDPPAIYLPINALERWGVAPADVTYSYWIHVDPSQVANVEAVLSFDVGTWGDGLHLSWVREDNIDAITHALLIFQVALTLIAGISLCTGGIGILNLGLVTVRQRVREFGQWRVFGASGLDIFSIVLLETVVVSLTGGAVAVACSFLVLTLLPSLLTSTPLGQFASATFPVEAAVLGLSVAALIGALAGLWPAWAATRTDVVDAIQQ